MFVIEIIDCIDDVVVDTIVVDTRHEAELIVRFWDPESSYLPVIRD